MEATDLTLDEKEIYGNVGDTVRLTATMAPENASLPYVFWRSTDPKIATVDNYGLVTLRVNTSELEGAECHIIAETLYADGPVAIAGIGGVPELSDIADIEADSAGGIDYSQPYDVYNLQGIRVGSAAGQLAPGVYIVRQGAKTAKIAK